MLGCDGIGTELGGGESGRSDAALAAHVRISTVAEQGGLLHAVGSAGEGGRLHVAEDELHLDNQEGWRTVGGSGFVQVQEQMQVQKRKRQGWFQTETPM